MKFYNISETAKILSVDRSTIYRWSKQGKIEIIFVNGLPRISEDEIKRLTVG